MHYEVPLPYPQSPAIGHYPELDESILHFFMIYFNTILKFMLEYAK
jgi:hypothetical protein